MKSGALARLHCHHHSALSAMESQEPKLNPGEDSGSQPAAIMAETALPTQTAEEPHPEPAGSAAAQPQNEGYRRHTIATLDLKVTINVDPDTHLSATALQETEDNLQKVKIMTRKFMNESLASLHEKGLVDDVPPAKKMRCGVNGAVWTDSRAY